MSRACAVCDALIDIHVETTETMHRWPSCPDNVMDDPQQMQHNHLLNGIEWQTAHLRLAHLNAQLLHRQGIARAALQLDTCCLLHHGSCLANTCDYSMQGQKRTIKTMQ